MKTMKAMILTAAVAFCAGAGFAAELAVPPGYRAVVVPVEKAEAVLEAADGIKKKEAGIREGIASGTQLADMIGFRALIYPQ